MARTVRRRPFQPRRSQVTLFFDDNKPRGIIHLFKMMNRLLPPMPGVCPDYPAPVVRNAGAERTDHDAVGNAAATELRRCTGTKGPTAISDPSRSSGSLVR